MDGDTAVVCTVSTEERAELRTTNVFLQSNLHLWTKEVDYDQMRLQRKPAEKSLLSSETSKLRYPIRIAPGRPFLHKSQAHHNGSRHTQPDPKSEKGTIYPISAGNTLGPLGVDLGNLRVLREKNIWGFSPGSLLKTLVTKMAIGVAYF